VNVHQDKLKKVVSVEFQKTEISATNNYFVAIDLDNSDDDYRHEYVEDGYVKLVGTSGILIKSKNSDIWTSVFGCVLSINATEATIGYLQLGALYAADTNQFIDRYALQTFPVELDLSILDNVYEKVTVSQTEVTSDINTSTTLKDAVGNDVTPAVGDMIVKVNKTAGSGVATVHYSLWYYVE